MWYIFIDMNTETFKDIVGYEGYYQISNYGNVRNAKTGKILKPVLNKNGYFHIKLSKNNLKKIFLIHRLVILHFLPNINDKKEVNHINGIKTDNRLENLEWMTRSENVLHSCYSLGNLIKSVIQMDLEGNILNIYKSITEASKENNINQSHISEVCKGNRKTTGGFKWAYAT